jgi:LysR family transcriptional regulator, transcriptional activator for leuABCD operon
VFNIRSVDLNLLPVFEAVYEEGSLSRAAVRLAMTQSAVSHAVSRLRLVFRDELFVRHSRGVVPTPAADAIHSKLRAALGSVRETVTEMRGFNARTSVRKFFLSIAHPLGPLILLRLQERLASVAPNIGVAASTRSRPIDLERALREGRVDASIDWLDPQDEPFKSAVLFDDALVAVAREGHPALRKPASMKVLRAGRFVSLRPRVEGEHPVPALREWQRLDLHVVLEVSEILEVFMVVSQSDLFGLIPRSMAMLARHSLGLRPLGPSPKLSTVPIKLFWHASRDADPAHVFLRKEIAAVATRIAKRG